MKKLWKLIHVMIKCGRSTNNTATNSAVAADPKQLITVVIGIVGAILMFMGGQYAAQNPAMFGDADTLFGGVMAIAGVLSFILSFMTAINQLYMSTDLDVLVTLPFSSTQIVAAKLVSMSSLPAMICLGLIIPSSIGYAVTSAEVSAMFVVCMVVGAITLLVYSVCAASLLVIVLMRCFKFIRNRNLISVITSLLMFGLTVVYMVTVSGRNNNVDAEQAVSFFNSIAKSAAGAAVVMPTIGFVIDAVNGNLLGLVWAVAATVAIVAVTLVLARALYFNAALSMTNASGTRGAISASEMKKATRKNSQSKALFRNEIKTILRTPSLISKGYLLSIAAPFLVLIPMALSLINSFQREGTSLTLESLVSGIASMNLPLTVYIAACGIVASVLASMAVGFSCLSRSLLSREGKDFYTLKAMPFSMVNLVQIKRNVVMCFNGISGILLPVILFIAGAVLGLIPWLAAIAGCIAAYAWTLGFINVCACADASKPNLDWDNETAVIKDNTIGAIIFLAAFLGSILLVIGVLSLELELEMAFAILSALYVGGSVLLAVITEVRLRQLSAKL